MPLATLQLCVLFGSFETLAAKKPELPKAIRRHQSSKSEVPPWHSPRASPLERQCSSQLRNMPDSQHKCLSQTRGILERHKAGIKCYKPVLVLMLPPATPRFSAPKPSSSGIQRAGASLSWASSMNFLLSCSCVVASVPPSTT